MFFFFRYRAALVLLAVLPLTGCLFRSRKVEQPVTTVQLKTATQQELIDYINTQAAKIQSMQATVDIDTTVGGVKKGKVTDYQEIRGYVLARKPAMLRMIGLMPIVRNKAFDMVSDGQRFKLWIPTKNRFVGRNDVENNNLTQPLENLRPQHIYDALLLRRIDPQNEIAVLENDTEIVTDAKSHKVSRAEYIIDVIHKDDHGWVLSRKLIFSRIDLLPHRQLIYDTQGNVSTNTLYWNYKKDDNGIEFPWQIEIARPQEEYDITLNIVKLDLNQPLADDKFELEQPPGAEVVHLDKSEAHSASAPQGDR